MWSQHVKSIGRNGGDSGPQVLGKATQDRSAKVIGIDNIRYAKVLIVNLVSRKQGTHPIPGHPWECVLPRTSAPTHEDAAKQDVKERICKRPTRTCSPLGSDQLTIARHDKPGLLVELTSKGCQLGASILLLHNRFLLNIVPENTQVIIIEPQRSRQLTKRTFREPFAHDGFPNDRIVG